MNERSPTAAVADRVDLNALLADSHVTEVLDELDAELIGLKPVKARIRDIAALLLVERARKQLGLVGGSPSLHMSQDAAQTSAAGREEVSEPIEETAVRSEWSSSRILA